MNKTLEDFLLNKKETLSTRVKQKVTTVTAAADRAMTAALADPLARKVTKECAAVCTAGLAAVTAGLFASTGALVFSSLIAEQTFCDGPLHKPSEHVMAGYLGKANAVDVLALHRSGGITVLDQKIVDEISDLTKTDPLTVKNASGAQLESLVDTSITTLSNQAFADTRLSEKDLARLHLQSGFKMAYNYSGAYMRNECAAKGLTDMKACLQDSDLAAPRTLEILLGAGIFAAGLLTAAGTYRLSYKEIEEKLDEKLPGHPDRPRQAKFDFK